MAPLSGVTHVFKSEPFERNGKTVTLYELSALQRIEHLEHLKTLESITDADMQAAMDMTIKSGALLVAMSLWHGHPLKGTHKTPKEDVEQIQNEVLMTAAGDCFRSRVQREAVIRHGAAAGSE